MKNKSLPFILILFLAVIIFYSCEEQSEDIIPDNQQIVEFDTSSITGKLVVDARYQMPNNGEIIGAPSGTHILLFATYEDYLNKLEIYDLIVTNSSRVNFGYFNFGNYYVWASNNIEGKVYEGLEAVQVRPRREEILNLTMFAVEN